MNFLNWDFIHVYLFIYKVGQPDQRLIDKALLEKIIFKLPTAHQESLKN